MPHAKASFATEYVNHDLLGWSRAAGSGSCSP
jgi:hypothetical protein